MQKKVEENKKMLSIRFLILFLLIFSTQNLFSESIIFGNSKEYAKSTIHFYKYEDRITYKKDSIFSLKFDADGNFSTEVNINSITFVFAEFGIYYAYFYLEPNSKYELILPEYLEKENKDIFNPFFEAQQLHLGIKNMEKSDLNYLIMDLNYYYDRFLSLKYEDLYTAKDFSEAEEFIKNINEKYKNEKNDYFVQYKRYKIATLKHLVTKGQLASDLVFSYYSKNKVLYDNPAYMDLFNVLYYSYFDQMLVSEQGATLYSIINKGHSIRRLNIFLSQKKELQNTQLREMVIMKGLYDCFSNKNISWLPLLLTLDSLNISTKYPQHKIISQNIADAVIELAPYTIAPNFYLQDTANIEYSLKDFKGKYVYLQFANTTSVPSQQELELLKKLYEKFYGDCIFVTILTDSDKDKAKKFIRRYKLKWTFLFTDDNSKTISDYQVAVYPTYFLITPEGFLKMSPAPSPSENIEKYILNILKEK